jgi:hypothetical protein
MLFFGSNCERLCMMQFSLISLIPGLIRNLQDCADPQLNMLEGQMVLPTSLKTSERASRGSPTLAKGPMLSSSQCYPTWVFHCIFLERSGLYTHVSRLTKCRGASLVHIRHFNNWTPLRIMTPGHMLLGRRILCFWRRRTDIVMFLST